MAIPRYTEDVSPDRQFVYLYELQRETIFACTVHIDGEATRSCQLPMSAIEGKSITTIEGLDADNQHPLQVAWKQHNVPQCGYCQSGQIMQAATLLAKNAAPSDSEIDQHMSGNICRCGTYPRIRNAIKDAAKGEAS